MTRSPETSLAQINASINQLKPVIDQIIEYSDPEALNKMLLEILSRPMEFSQLMTPNNSGMVVDQRIIEGEKQLLNEYNEYKQMLARIIRSPAYSNPNIFDWFRNQEAEKIFGTEWQKTASQDLATDYEFGIVSFGPNHSTFYLNWFYSEVTNAFGRRQRSVAEELDDRGLELNEMGEYEKAIEYHRKAIEQSPNFCLAWVNLGIALKNSGKYRESFECYKHVIENIDEGYKKAWHNAAVVAVHLGHVQDAFRFCNVALEIDPFYEMAVVLKGRLERYVAMKKKSTKNDEKEEKLKPDVLFLGSDPDFFEMMSDMYAEEGKSSVLLGHSERREKKAKPKKKSWFENIKKKLVFWRNK
jgi:tetratricopeptide (TPR) repeat protein